MLNYFSDVFLAPVQIFTDRLLSCKMSTKTIQKQLYLVVQLAATNNIPLFSVTIKKICLINNKKTRP